MPGRAVNYGLAIQLGVLGRPASARHIDACSDLANGYLLASFLQYGNRRTVASSQNATKQRSLLRDKSAGKESLRRRCLGLGERTQDGRGGWCREVQSLGFRSEVEQWRRSQVVQRHDQRSAIREEVQTTRYDDESSRSRSGPQNRTRQDRRQLCMCYSLTHLL